MVVIGDFLLAAICQPDKLSTEVWYFPGAPVLFRIEWKDSQNTFKPTDKDPFLLICMGTNDNAKHSLEDTARGYKTPGNRVKEL